MGLARWMSVVGAMLVVFAHPALAQMMPPQGPMTSAGTGAQLSGGGWEQQLFGGGWAQLSNLPELIAFGQDAVLTLLLAALIVFHPVRRRMRRTLEDLMIPRLFFLYALIGMAVGFLVIQHGYIIGFVVFGIGALLRFRSTLDNAADTVEVILITVIGLSVGLGLPVMAVLFAVVGWGLIWVAGRTRGYEVTLRAKDTALANDAILALNGLVSGQGWTCVSTHQIPAKQSCQFVLVVPGALQPDAFESAVADVLPEGVEFKTRF